MRPGAKVTSPAATAAIAEDVEWHGHPHLPEPGPYRSREEVERWMVQFREAWGELSAEPVELIDAGDSAVALVRMTGRGRGSGVEVRGGVDVHVMTFRDGAVVYFRIHPGNFLLDHPKIGKDELELLILRVKDGLELSEIAKQMSSRSPVPGQCASTRVRCSASCRRASRCRELPDRGARLGHGDEPAGDPRQLHGGARESRWSGSPRTSPKRRRSSGPQRPGSRPRPSRPATTRTARLATRRWPTGSRALERRPGRARRLHAAALARVRRALPRAGSSTCTRRCCRRSRASTRSARRSTTASRITGVTVHFVDEGVDSGPIILQRPVPVPAEPRTGETRGGDPRRPSTRCCPEAIRLIAAGRVRIDPENPRLVHIDPMNRLATTVDTVARDRSERAGESLPVRRALISVSDKTGVADFAAGSRQLGVEIVSTGGTARGAARGRARGRRRRGVDRASRRSSTAG